MPLVSIEDIEHPLVFTHAVYIKFSDAPVHETQEVNTDWNSLILNIDYTEDGDLVGVEIITSPS